MTSITSDNMDAIWKTQKKSWIWMSFCQVILYIFFCYFLCKFLAVIVFSCNKNPHNLSMLMGRENLRVKGFGGANA